MWTQNPVPGDGRTHNMMWFGACAGPPLRIHFMRSQVTFDREAPMPEFRLKPTFLKAFTIQNWGNAR